MNSDNSGDNIIMENCINILKDNISVEDFVHIPTHTYPTDEQIKSIENIDKKVVCGTNILSGDMKSYGLWKIPNNIENYNEIVLMGVGFASKKIINLLIILKNY